MKYLRGNKCGWVNTLYALINRASTIDHIFEILDTLILIFDNKLRALLFIDIFKTLTKLFIIKNL